MNGETGIDVVFAATAKSCHHDQRMQAIGIGNRRYNDLTLVLGIGQIIPRCGCWPAIFFEGLFIVSQTGCHEADPDSHVRVHFRNIVYITEDGCILDRITKPERDGLVHRAIVEEYHIEFLASFLRLELGQCLGRITRHILLARHKP